MNPIVHTELSWLMGQSLSSRRDRLLVVAAGVAPDLDGLTVLGGRELYAGYHHLLTHNVAAALAMAVVAWAGSAQRWRCVAIALLAFHLHLLCDLAGSGPGWPVAYLWPLSDRFFGWDGGWELDAWPNVLIGLVASLACLLAAVPWQRTAVELFSARADAAIVRTVRERLLGRS